METSPPAVYSKTKNNMTKCLVYAKYRQLKAADQITQTSNINKHNWKKLLKTQFLARIKWTMP